MVLFLAGLVFKRSDYVNSIQIVNNRGKLVKLESIKSETTNKETSVKDVSDDDNQQHDDNDKQYHIVKNNKFVSDISFTTEDKPGQGSSYSSRVNPNFTSPRPDEDEKARLSGYILDENSNTENSFDYRSNEGRQTKKKYRNEIFPTAILDSNDELTNLYKTISRKQILSKVQCSSFPADPGHRSAPVSSVSGGAEQRPLARILNMLHSAHTNENMYTSIHEDSVYQSLQTTATNNDKSNKSNPGETRIVVNCF